MTKHHDPCYTPEPTHPVAVRLVKQAGVIVVVLTAIVVYMTLNP